MRLLVLTLTLAIACLSYAQDMTEQICKLYDAGSYKEVVSTYGSQQSSLSYKGLFHVGLSYYKLGKDKTAIDIMDKCISRNKKDSGPHYIKGKSLSFMKQYSKAAKAFDKAIALDDDSGNYYSGLGDAYMGMNQLDKALSAYQSATRFDDCPERAFHKIPLILTAAGKTQPALEAYYAAKERLDKDSENYPRVLFTIGLHESMNQDYFDAKLILDELVKLDPTYYKAYPILIQANIGLRKYDAVMPLKEALYSAHSAGKLENSLNEKFCFDQFAWENKLVIKAYERFESATDKTYFKHIYEVAENNTLAYNVQTKHLPNADKPLVLQKSIGLEEYTYAAEFDTKCKYDELKIAVINVITEKIEPVE